MDGFDVRWIPTLLRISLLVAVRFGTVVEAHNDDAPAAACATDAMVTVQAAFRPGVITVDGNSKDWDDVKGFQFGLLPALGSGSGHAYPHGSGKMEIKVLHDGRDVYFLLQVPGIYVYQSGEPTRCASVALMFGVGDDATYNSMGGCQASVQSCSSSTCGGHEVDIMHFSTSNAIPGRMYGSNVVDNLNGTGKDSFGNLNDLYSWNPHCRYLDGVDPTGYQGNGAQNDWHGAWAHSSIDGTYGFVQSDNPYGKLNGDGTYIFEFARALRTHDRLQQDVQFSIGGTSRFAAAFWYPINEQPWTPSQHYSINCAWVPLEILPATNGIQVLSKVLDGFSVLAVVLALAALGTATAVGWYVKSNNRVSFTSISNL